MTAKIALLAAFGSAWFMAGLIAFVQVVHYPLFARVHLDAFRSYHAEHTRATGLVVALPMLVELLAAAYLVFDRPPGTGPRLAWAGLIAALATWGITGLCSVPAHNVLARGFDAAAHRTLVATNVVRAVAWFAHAGIATAMVARALR